MANNDVQEILNRILADLRSNEETRQLAAIHELGTIRYSSEAIVRELERLALREEGTAQRFALNALRLSTSQFVISKLSTLSKHDRQLILREINKWQEEGLIDNRAEIIRQRYDFDIKRASSVQPASTKDVTELAEAPALVSEIVTKGSEKKPDVPEHSAARGARPSLTQTLLSEASIKVYLYLGAFFVIASALILAALVEAARLPILAVATLAFGGGALAIRKRLPQPSFALFTVFSFLLPIDANVLEEMIGLREPSLSIYWTTIFFLMAVIWSFSVWFYESRFLSALAFISLSLAFYRVGEIFNTETELQIFFGMLASLMGLAGAFVLRTWKDSKFSSFIFWLAQLQVLGLLFASLAFALNQIFDSDFSNGWWMLFALTWLSAASFYVLSDTFTPIWNFPWMAVAALLPLPWFFLNTFNVTQPAYAFGFWVWGAGFALASQAALRLPSEKMKKYYWPFLAGSAPLFLTAFSIALVWDEPVLSFTIFALTAFLYTALHLLSPRWFVWSAALLNALLAYFTFFYLPTIESLAIPFVYQILIVSLLLVVPELFTRSSLALKSKTRWPTIASGIFMSLLGISLALIDRDHAGRGALVLTVYAVLFTLHALHSKQEWLGYFATATGSLALIYVLDHFNLDLWLQALTMLAVIYYVTGFFFRHAGDLKAWSDVVMNSGLALGVLLSFASLVLSKEASGWYIIVIALLFMVEMYVRPFAWLELAVDALLSLSLYMILDDFNIGQIGHFLFGASLIWLGSDLVLGHLVQAKRVYRPITLVAGYILACMATLALWGDLNSTLPTIYFSLYAVFFSMYSFLQRAPRLGYIAAGFLPLAVIKLCDVVSFEKWIFPLIILAVLYYASGYRLRRNQKAEGWDTTLLYSGLGLGVLTSIAAPFQGGLAASLPIAIAATLFAVEAFALRSVWWALPANALYLMSYFMILTELKVDEPQFYSIGAALLGMLMHYLLTRAGSRTGAFTAGMISQFVLLGTTYIQMLSTERFLFFVILFVQALMVLVYGLTQRSRSLVVTPIVFVVLGVVTVIYSALKGLGTVILIGSTGVALLLAGIVAVLLRERITRLGEQLSDWRP